MQVKANWLDRAVLWAAPAKGMARMQARARATMLQSVYDGASPSHRNSARRYAAGDANSAVRSGAKRLKYAARDLERNNPLAARGFSVLTNNVIGAGVIPAVQGVPNQKRRDALQKIVNKHCDKSKIDVAGRQNLYGQQAVAFHAAVRDGESLMVRRRARAAEKLPLPFQIAVYESDHFDDRVHGVLPNGNFAIEGIEFSPLGAPVAYHLYNRHPGDTSAFVTLQSTRYPAEDVVHLYRIDRPGQAKGVSWASPVLVRLGDIDDTKDAYILRQKIAACFAAFVKRTGGAGEPEDVDTKSASGLMAETLEPGIIEYLSDGEDVTFGTPPVVGDLEGFFRIGARDIAAGLGITYEALTGDLSNVNFSSGRMGWLEMQRNIGAWTEHMILPQMCEKIGQWIMDGLRLVASVPPTAEIGWTPPRREMIDPGAELKAAAQAAKDGLGTRSRFLRSLGFDPEEVDQERADELAREEELGLSYDTNVSTLALAIVAAAKALAAPPALPAPGKIPADNPANPKEDDTNA